MGGGSSVGTYFNAGGVKPNRLKKLLATTKLPQRKLHIFASPVQSRAKLNKRGSLSKIKSARHYNPSTRNRKFDPNNTTKRMSTKTSPNTSILTQLNKKTKIGSSGVTALHIIKNTYKPQNTSKIRMIERKKFSTLRTSLTQSKLNKGERSESRSESQYSEIQE